MAVWTISAQAGTAGDRIAARLATAAGVPLVDRASLAAFAHELNPAIGDVDELEERVGGPLRLAALSIGATTGSVDAFRELQLRQTLPTLGKAIMSEAARLPCVILATAAFAALPEHTAAVHARLWAPPAWRVRAYQRDCIVDAQCAEKAVKRADHLQHVWVKSLSGVDIEAGRRFTLALDASRLSEDRLVEVLLAAAGVTAVENDPGGVALAS
jgi:hypothetical protein